MNFICPWQTSELAPYNQKLMLTTAFYLWKLTASSACTSRINRTTSLAKLSGSYRTKYLKSLNVYRMDPFSHVRCTVMHENGSTIAGGYRYRYNFACKV